MEKITIIFKGGFWVDKQEFIITKVEENKISMLSCGKHDNCKEAYFIRE